MDVKPRVVAAAGCALLLVVAGPYGGAIGQDISSSTVEQPLSLDCDPTLSDAMRPPASPGGSETLRRGDVRREWTHVPDLPQQQDGHVLAGGCACASGRRPERRALPPRWTRRWRGGNEPDHRACDGPDRDPAASGRGAVGRSDPQERDPQSRHADDDEHPGARSTADVRHP